MRVNVDGLIKVNRGVRPPAERVQNVVRVLGSEPGEHDAPAIGFSIAISICQVQ